MKRPVFQVKPTDNSYESYLAWQDGKIMLFRKPPALRRAQLSFFGLCVLITCSGLIAALALQEPALLYVESLGFPLSSICLHLCGPDDIRLDGTQRTYERTVGWPWKPKTRLVSFSGIKGICIISQRERQAQVMQNTVLLLLEKPEFVAGGGVVSGSYSVTSEAHALAEELSRVYGFPIVPYPKT